MGRRGALAASWHDSPFCSYQAAHNAGPGLAAICTGAEQQTRGGRGHNASTRAYLPGDVGLPAPPGLTQVLQDGASLVLLHTLGHHVQDVVHDSRSELQIKVGLNALLGHLRTPKQQLYTDWVHSNIMLCMLGPRISSSFMTRLITQVDNSATQNHTCFTFTMVACTWTTTTSTP